MFELVVKQTLSLLLLPSANCSSLNTEKGLSEVPHLRENYDEDQHQRSAWVGIFLWLIWTAESTADHRCWVHLIITLFSTLLFSLIRTLFHLNPTTTKVLYKEGDKGEKRQCRGYSLSSAGFSSPSQSGERGESTCQLGREDDQGKFQVRSIYRKLTS